MPFFEKYNVYKIDILTFCKQKKFVCTLFIFTYFMNYFMNSFKISKNLYFKTQHFVLLYCIFNLF